MHILEYLVIKGLLFSLLAVAVYSLVLILPVFFVTRWLYKRDNDRSVDLKAFILSVVLTLFVTLIYFGLRYAISLQRTGLFFSG